MTDAISRSAVLEMAYCAIKPTQDCPSIKSVVDVEDIEKLPAIDVAPVVHARWDAEHRCTECICLCTTVKAPQGHLVFVETPYCPNCGARMDGEAE